MIDYLNKFRLDKKIAYVVGGLGLIGKEVSTAYAMAGAKTIVLDIKKKEGLKYEKKMKSLGYNLKYVFFDCKKTKEIESSFSKILHKNNCPDIFINCSYPYTKDWPNNSFNKIKFKSFKENVDIHMNSYAWLAKLTAECMLKYRKKGCVIQLGSVYGLVGQDNNIYKNTSMKENMSYSVIKGGIINLSRQMASYYGKFNIRFNSLCPGALTGHISGVKSKQNINFIKRYSLKTPLKRLGKAEEVASAALFLSSDAASYITGSTLMVDGGITSVL